MTGAARRRVAAVVPLALIVAVALAGQLSHSPVAVAAAQPPGDDALVVGVGEGRDLYLTGCVSCHGAEGVGVEARGPTLVGVGAAAVDFWVGTGRMPAAAGTYEQSKRKAPVYDAAQIDALTAYIETFGGGGPPVPEVNLEAADLALGGELYRANCAACHNSAGIGGALSYGNWAPALDEAAPLQVVEAMRIGPGQMPVFGEDALPGAEADAIAAYVQYLKDPSDPGGLSLGRVGPVTEGFVALLLGLGGVFVISVWVVGRRHG